jgi:hypothetical protein
MEADRLPEHALLIVEERLREQEAEDVRMPESWNLTCWPYES